MVDGVYFKNMSRIIKFLQIVKQSRGTPSQFLFGGRNRFALDKAERHDENVATSSLSYFRELHDLAVK